ncbi:TetR family transcriptional regulator C-terminal domain-containing protein [Actinomyces naeslundii]|uniref:TetR family transcriptional regulator C-terminal domain-containing protein n=1 Tax=Actinomyces naeslundii TaxID=1655 RepID=UPI00211628EA|nr:TetR family transcriptional regulator C-terminal domain-containing protein [Actinomyces naeslundii]
MAAAAANSPLCQAKSVRRSWPDLDIEAETTALHGLVDGLAIHLLVNPDPGFRRQTLRKIEVSTDRLRPETWSPSGCASTAGTT